MYEAAKGATGTLAEDKLTRIARGKENDQEGGPEEIETINRLRARRLRDRQTQKEAGQARSETRGGRKARRRQTGPRKTDPITDKLMHSENSANAREQTSKGHDKPREGAADITIEARGRRRHSSKIQSRKARRPKNNTKTPK